MSYSSFIKKELMPHISAFLADRRAAKDPDFFPYFGTQIYCGRQGSGKTISAVRAALRLKERYPKAILVTNLSLPGYRAISTAGYVRMCYTGPNQARQAASLSKEYASATVTDPLTGRTERISDIDARTDRFDSERDYVHFSEVDELHAALTQVNNGFHGVIYLIDEIHAYFNSLESKDTPITIFAEISQQRKQRKLILGTSQLFMRVAKALREQCDNIIICNTLFGCVTTLRAYDGMEIEQARDGSLIGRIKKTGIFWHTVKDREAYDTFQKIWSSFIPLEENPYMSKRHAKFQHKMEKKMKFR